MFFDVTPKSKASKPIIEIDRLHVLSEKLEDFDLFTDQELYEAIGSTLIFDIECYPNYFMIAFKSFTSRKVVYFELSPTSTIDYDKLEWIVWRFLLVGFNSINYDIPMLFMCLKGLSCAQLKSASDRIINEKLRPRNIESEFSIVLPTKINHIDLIEVAPLTASLKTYAGRLHCQKMQDLPFEPHLPLTQQQAEFVKHYCINDLDNTALLFLQLQDQIKLRYDLTQEYGIDLRSKSDAQIAEHVLASEVAKINGHWPRRPAILEGQTYQYQVHAFLAFATPQLQAFLATISLVNFQLDESGYLSYPKDYTIIDKCAEYLYSKTDKHKKIGFTCKVNKGVYSFALGGLHSTEEKICHKSDDEFMLIDRDVASYYPAIILNQELFPKQMGKAFLKVYRSIVERRLAAKKAKDKVTADSLKITINGSFGKLGSKYSNLYSPDLLLQVTITGQLALLMLIERIELAGIEIVSANTDGIVIKCPRKRYNELNTIVAQWEKETCFETEETRYKGLYSMNVNNYIAVKEDDKTKGKGCFSSAGLSRNPSAEICIDAVMNLLVGNTPIEDTVIRCKDVTKFLVVRNVKGGAHKNGKYLGKVVRWYHSTEETGCIQYILSGNKVPKSDGARPMMNLAPIPEDLNFDYYIKETEEMLYDIGYFKPKQRGLF